jgi:hypothetical protein
MLQIDGIASGKETLAQQLRGIGCGVQLRGFGCEVQLRGFGCVAQLRGAAAGGGVRALWAWR